MVGELQRSQSREAHGILSRHLRNAWSSSNALSGSRSLVRILTFPCQHTVWLTLYKLQANDHKNGAQVW